MKFTRDDTLLAHALELSEDTDRYIVFHCADGDVVTRSIFLRLHSRLISGLVDSVTSNPGARCEYSIMLPDIPRTHILHILELITEGVSEVCAGTDEVINLTHGVIHTARFLGINISRGRNDPIMKPKENQENKYPLRVNSEEVEKTDPSEDKCADGWLRRHGWDEDSRQSGNKLVELKESKFMKEEEKIDSTQVSESQNSESSEFKHTESLMKIEAKESLVQDIILVSKEGSNVGPIRNRYTNSEPDNNFSSHHHPYAWWGQGNPFYMNHANFSRGIGVGRWPRPSRGPGLLGNYPRGGFGWYMDRPFWN